MNDFDLAVIGAGAVGLAISAEAARRGLSVIVLEKERIAGLGNSSRNSEVIHAGIYYSTDTLKHRLCVSGRIGLYNFLQKTNVAFHKCGKLVVATSEPELTKLSTIFANAIVNGVEGVELIDAEAIAHLEPEVTALGALWSPETGIFDSHGYMAALISQLESFGGIIAFCSTVARVIVSERRFTIFTSGVDGTSITATRLVNSAGLMAPQVSAQIDGLHSMHIPTQRMAKGSYFNLIGKAPFTHLIYPTPVDGGLGVHATLNLAGQVRFGPDVEWLPTDTMAGDVSYEVDPSRANVFYSAIRSYWPGLKTGALSADYAGCRPKLTGPGEPSEDFVIQSEKTHGLFGLVNLFGIESPGLTASLALADEVCRTALHLE